MAAIALGCAALAGWLFRRRDLGEVVRLPLPPLPARLTAPRAAATWLLRSPLQRAFRSSLGAAFAWGLALAAYAAMITALAPGVRDALEDQAGTQDFIERLQRGGVSTETTFLALALSTLVTAMIAIFAITLPISWSSEERLGQLELDLTTPIPRGRYFVERMGAALLTSAVVVALVGGAVLVTAWLAGVDLAWGRALVAVLLLLPLAGVFIAFGFAVSAWRPGPVAAILSGALAISFLLDLLAPLLSLPDALRDLSVFHMYGQPLTEGVSWGGLAAMLALIAVFSFAGSRLFARRDIVK
jgi:ABC-2 type transport system permease protein